MNYSGQGERLDKLGSSRIPIFAQGNTDLKHQNYDLYNSFFR